MKDLVLNKFKTKFIKIELVQEKLLLKNIYSYVVNYC